ncbi:hypothetical protein [Telmatospirillum sp.]|uniref:hypothetical protein n=1 Tax=Telmatospirillum sp. TaxID=2079197 RepID=UPI00283EE606|nr:hypothetical protein [Telmatospirillum sp.]MDR3438969.1 hypothetical protein [Telmatospirillum sp.]
MNERERLPDRRDNTSQNFEWNNGEWTMTVGWDNSGAHVREIFLKGAKEGTHLEAWAEDDCFLVSQLLQCGAEIQNLAARLPYHHIVRPDDGDTGAIKPSLIAVAIAVAAQIELDESQNYSNREIRSGASTVIEASI